MTMRLVGIVATDWAGPNPAWVRQPWLDGGRLRFDRQYRADWDNVFYEAAGIAGVHAVALGCRGTYDPGAVACLPIARDAYRDARPQPAITFWADTVGLPDITHNRDGTPFDFTVTRHLEYAWEYFAWHFFRHFLDAPLERTPRGRVMWPWWGIASDNGHGFRNQAHAQNLLDHMDMKLTALGLGPADHVVDKTWMEYAPQLQVYGVHDWFNPWSPSPHSYSVRRHGDVVVGVVVPSFFNPLGGELIQPENGATARRGLLACRAAGAQIVLLEGITDFQEAAEYMRDASGNVSKLLAVRAASDVAPPVPEPLPGGSMTLAISTDPILHWTTGVLVKTTLGTNRYALRWTQRPGEPGRPDPTSPLYMCLNPDGTTEAKAVIDEWEASQEVAPTDLEIRWFTTNAAGTHSACIVYALQQFT